jgi:hypothetical protein
MRTRDILRAAKRDGKAAGLARASWCFDGNTTDETYRAFLKGFLDGDPAVMDQFNPPNLSGEYADDPTPHTLAEDYGTSAEDLDGVCQAWEDAASEAFWGELERVARYHLGARFCRHCSATILPGPDGTRNIWSDLEYNASGSGCLRHTPRRKSRGTA